MENPKYLATNTKSEFSELIQKTANTDVEHTSFSTKCIHDGQHPDPIHGAVNVPIFMSTTYAQTAPAKPIGKFDYTRCGNPTVDSLCQLMASIEHAQYGQIFSSGCGATACITSLLNSGEHIL